MRELDLDFRRTGRDCRGKFPRSAGAYITRLFWRSEVTVRASVGSKQRERSCRGMTRGDGASVAYYGRECRVMRGAIDTLGWK